MRVTFYGARGSIATPLTLNSYQEKIKEILNLYSKSEEKNIDIFFNNLPFHLSHIFGGNTSCVTIEDDKQDEIYIIDAGSGIRELGRNLANRSNLTIHIFLSHFHWDHICGIPFFKPLYNPTNSVIFYSTNENLIENLMRQQHNSHFPLAFDKLPAKKSFVILDKHLCYNIGDFNVRNLPLYHPGGSTAYIFEKNNKKISYVSDAEFTPDNIKDKEMIYKACFESSDLLIIDSQYSLIEFFNKFDWGHTSSTMAVNLALEWRVKKLVLFHFDPEHSDLDMIKIIEDSRNFIKYYNLRKLDILQVVEGQSIEI